MALYYAPARSRTHVRAHTRRLHGTAILAAGLLAGLAPAIAGCGHRGPPLPPLRRTPPGLAEFRLAQRGEALEVSLLTPVASVDGLPFERLVVEILHAQGELDLEKAGTRREVLAYPRQRVVETLPLPPPGTVARAAARGVVGREKGQRTLTMALVAQDPVAPPRALEARLVEGGVELAWQGELPTPVSAVVRPKSPLGGLFAPRPAGAPPGVSPAETGVESPPPSPQARAGAPASPAQAVAGAPAAVPKDGEPRPPGSPQGREEEKLRSGFHVYRRVGTESFHRPLVQGLIGETHTVDTGAPLGATACYVVRAAASVEPLVESAASNEACLDVRDIEPPAAPAGLAVLPRESGLEVLWSPSPEPDLAGYRVYRRSDGEPRARVAELEPARTSWLDEGARAGVAWFYEVTAVDRSGNESLPAQAAEASRP